MTSLTPAQLIKAAGAPEYAKIAHVDSYEDFAVNSKDATFISYAKALVKNATGDQWQQLEDHIRFWGIASDCAKLKNKYAELSEVAELPESDYTLVKEYGGQTVRKFAAYDAPSTVKSAVALYETREAFPYEWRNEVATKLLAKTASYQAQLPAYVELYLQKAAAFGAVGEAQLEQAYIERDLVCPAQHRDAFEKVAEVISALMDSSELRADHDFVKEAMAAIDSYDSLVPGASPVEELIPDSLVVSRLEKVASDESDSFVKLSNGHEVDIRTIDKATLDMIDEKLSKLAGAELRDVLATIPRPDADLLCRAIA